MKILSKLHSIIASGRDIPDEMSKEDLDMVHIVNELYRGNTLCELTVAHGVRVVNTGQIHKVNCQECIHILGKLKGKSKEKLREKLREDLQDKSDEDIEDKIGEEMKDIKENKIKTRYW